MRRFRVTVHGCNLLTRVEGVARRVGFYATVLVDASTPSEAGGEALAVVRATPRLQALMLNGPQDPVALEAEGVEAEEVPAGGDPPGGGVPGLQGGFALYLQDTP